MNITKYPTYTESIISTYEQLCTHQLGNLDKWNNSLKVTIYQSLLEKK